MMHRKLIIVFIVFSTLVACGNFSSATPIVEETKGDDSPNKKPCTQTHLVQWCIDFAVPLADGSVQIYLSEKMDPGLSALPALMLADFSDKEKFILIDNLGNETEPSQIEQIIIPLNQLPEIQDDLSLFFANVGLLEGQSIDISVPFIGYKMPIDGILSIPLDTASPDARITIEQNILVNNREIRFEEASLVEFDTSESPVYVDGIRIEGATSGDVGSKETYLVVKGSPGYQDEAFFIIGLSVLDQTSGASIDPVTGQLNLYYRLTDEEQKTETIDIQLVSAYVIEKGPFPISFTLPYGDTEKLSMLTQYLSQSSEIPGDIDLSIEVFVGLSSYSGDNLLLIETIGCLLDEGECRNDAKVISQSWTPNDVFQLSPDRKAAILVNNDSGHVAYYDVNSNNWQLVDERFVHSPLVIWKRDSSGFAINTEVDKLKFWSVQDGHVVLNISGIFPGLRQAIGWISDVELLVAYETPIVAGTGEVLLGVYNIDINSWYPFTDDSDLLIEVDFSLSPHENTLLFNDTNTSFLMSLDTFEVIHLPGFPPGWLVWSPNSNMVASIINDNKCVGHLLNVDTLESKKLFETSNCYNFAWLPDNNYVLVIETNLIDDDLNMYLISTITGIGKQIPLPEEWQKYQLINIY